MTHRERQGHGLGSGMLAIVSTAVAVSLLTSGCSSSTDAGSTPARADVATATASADAKSPASPGTEPVPPARALPSGANPADYSNPSYPEQWGFLTPSTKWLCVIQHFSDTDAQASCTSNPHQDALPIPNDPLAKAHDGEGTLMSADVIRVAAGADPTFDRSSQSIWAVNDLPRVLPYDSVLEVAGFSCNAQESGVSCKDDSTTKGFSISTAGYQLSYTEVPARVPAGGQAPAAPQPSPTPSVSEEGVQDCGPLAGNADQSEHVINDTALVRCSDAVDVIQQYIALPGTRAGDRSGNVGRWECGILGAVEAGQRGYGIICTTEGGQITVTNGNPGS